MRPAFFSSTAVRRVCTLLAGEAGHTRRSKWGLLSVFLHAQGERIVTGYAIFAAFDAVLNLVPRDGQLPAVRALFEDLNEDVAVSCNPDGLLCGAPIARA